MSSNMTFVFQQGDEEPQALPLGKPGRDIGIAWGEPTRRATIWGVIVNPKGDVYVMERKTGSYLKASLHQSKTWRYAWIERAASQATRCSRCRGDGRPGDRSLEPTAGASGRQR
jgi:hypothetical protein